MSPYKPIELGLPCPSCGYIIAEEEIYPIDLFGHMAHLPCHTFECPNCSSAHAFESRDLRSYRPKSKTAGTSAA